MIKTQNGKLVMDKTFKCIKIISALGDYKIKYQSNNQVYSQVL